MGDLIGGILEEQGQVAFFYVLWNMGLLHKNGFYFFYFQAKNDMSQSLSLTAVLDEF
jgi:hypothetical protein